MRAWAMHGAVPVCMVRACVRARAMHGAVPVSAVRACVLGPCMVLCLCAWCCVCVCGAVPVRVRGAVPVLLIQAELNLG